MDVSLGETDLVSDRVPSRPHFILVPFAAMYTFCVSYCRNLHTALCIMVFKPGKRKSANSAKSFESVC
jgi:hypothetical protein